MLLNIYKIVPIKLFSFSINWLQHTFIYSIKWLTTINVLSKELYFFQFDVSWPEVANPRATAVCPAAPREPPAKEVVST